MYNRLLSEQAVGEYGRARGTVGDQKKENLAYSEANSIVSGWGLMSRKVSIVDIVSLL